MQVNFADGGRVMDGVPLYWDRRKDQRFVHLPPGGFLLVEPCCLECPDVCRWAGEQVSLVCCEPSRIPSGEVRFSPSQSPKPRLILAHFDRSLIAFSPKCPEPPSYRSWVALDTRTSRTWEVSHHDVEVPNNGSPTLLDRECWALATMAPGDTIRATISLRDPETLRNIVFATGDVLVCESDGSFTMKQILAERR